MARWGEGDPRWIVEEREDAKNVNNWHWTEKNATQWSVDTIKNLFVNFLVEDDDFICDNLEVTKCDGEAYVNNRKGKLIFLYEWVISAEWSGKRKTGDNKTHFRGQIDITNMGDEYKLEELDVSVACTSSTGDGEAMAGFIRNMAVPLVKEKLGIYLKKLREEYSQNVILPTKTTKPTTGCGHPLPTVTSANDLKQNEDVMVTRNPKDLAPKELVFSDEFFCSPDHLYKVLTTRELVQAFTRGEAVVEATTDGRYSIFGGNITGTFISLTPDKVIEMRWRKSDWPEGHHSHLVIELDSHENGTQLKLTQSAVPSYDMENTLNGWQSNIFAAIKQTYGFGGRIF